MHTVSIEKKHVARAVAAIVLALGAGQAFGAAFALQEQNASGLGNDYAGGAAVAEDASTVWANPAGMARFSTIQIVAAVNAITPSDKFRDDGSSKAFNQPLGNTGGDAGDTTTLPAYIVVPINNSFAFGLGIGVPFGLKTDWDDGWLGCHQALVVEDRNYQHQPALSWKINDQFSVGVGVDYQQVKVIVHEPPTIRARRDRRRRSPPRCFARGVQPFINATQNLIGRERDGG